MTNRSKKCTRCKDVKPLSDFRKKNGYADGYTSQCIECEKEKEQLKKDQEREYGKKYFTF